MPMNISGANYLRGSGIDPYSVKISNELNDDYLYSELVEHLVDRIQSNMPRNIDEDEFSSMVESLSELDDMNYDEAEDYVNDYIAKYKNFSSADAAKLLSGENPFPDGATQPEFTEEYVEEDYDPNSMNEQILSGIFGNMPREIEEGEHESLLEALENVNGNLSGEDAEDLINGYTTIYGELPDDNSYGPDPDELFQAILAYKKNNPNYRFVGGDGDYEMFHPKGLQIEDPDEYLDMLEY